MSDFEVQWTEILSSERTKLEQLGAQIGIHPLAVEDCLHSNQRAKFEDFENHQLLVWFIFLDGDAYELEFVIFPHRLILVTSDPAPNGRTWREYLHISTNHRDAYHMLYQALDKAMDLSSAHIRPLLEAINEFEETILRTTSDPRGLLDLKRSLSRAEFSLAFLSSIVAQWQRFLNPRDDLRWRLRDLWDHCERTHQLLVFSRGQVASAMEMYWGVTAKRTNDQIKKLTMVASVAVPLTFWTSFFGMNFETIPFKEPWLFYGTLIGMALSVGGIYLFLRRKGYWEQN